MRLNCRKKELVNRYGYPEADLSEIDLAWI